MARAWNEPLANSRFMWTANIKSKHPKANVVSLRVVNALVVRFSKVVELTHGLSLHRERGPCVQLVLQIIEGACQVGLEIINPSDAVFRVGSNDILDDFMGPHNIFPAEDEAQPFLEIFNEYLDFFKDPLDSMSHCGNAVKDSFLYCVSDLHYNLMNAINDFDGETFDALPGRVKD